MTEPRIVTVKPISRKAKNRFCNIMRNDGDCFVEQVKGTRMFLMSARNKNQFFWVDTVRDQDWEVEL